MLEELGKTADEVALILRMKGVQGVRNTARFLNPIVRFMHMQLRDYAVQIDVMKGSTLCITYPNGSREESVLSPAIRDFLDAFNRGAYPDLEMPMTRTSTAVSCSAKPDSTATHILE